MFQYHIHEPSECITIREDILNWLAQELEILFPQETAGIVTIAFLDDVRIQELNHQYRGIDKTTDVLSFHYFDDFSALQKDEVAGELILSESRVLEQAKEFKETPEAECMKLIIHSSLHLLGYDHEEEEDYKEMRELEKYLETKLLDQFNIKIHE